jgi:hypothetical protein
MTSEENLTLTDEQSGNMEGMDFISVKLHSAH